MIVSALRVNEATFGCEDQADLSQIGHGWSPGRMGLIRLTWPRVTSGHNVASIGSTTMHLARPMKSISLSSSNRLTLSALLGLGLLAGNVRAADAPATTGGRPERSEQAGGPGGREGGRAGGMMRMMPLMVALDTNQDGALTKEELTALVSSDGGLGGGRGRDREGGGDRRRDGTAGNGGPQ
jgi:hypothetical protein